MKLCKNDLTATEVTMSENRAACSSILESSQLVCGKRIAEIPLPLLRVDEGYQRTIAGSRWAKINKMAEHFDENKAGLILVSYRPAFGAFFIVDGQGRYQAAKIAGLDSLACQIRENCSVKDEAKLFVEQDDNETKLSAHNKFKAGMIAEMENCVSMNTIMQRYGIDRPQQVRAIGTALNLAQTNPTELDWIFRMIHNSGWDSIENGFSRSIMLSLKTLYEHEFVRASELEEKLVPVMAMNSPNQLRAVAELIGNPRRMKYMNLFMVLNGLVNDDKLIIHNLVKNGIKLNSNNKSVATANN